MKRPCSVCSGTWGPLRIARRSGSFPVALGLLLASCAADDPDDQATPSWILQPQFRLGGVTEGEVLFSDIRGVEVDRQGRTYVLDALAQQITVVDSNGALVRTLGRPGDGPGEFRGAIGIALNREDQLLVYDARAQRITTLDSAGRVARTDAVVIPTYGAFWVGGVDGAGRVYDEQFMEVGESIDFHIRRIDLDKRQVDSLARPRCADLTPMVRFERGVMRVPFAAGEYFAMDARGYVWCGHSSVIHVFEYVLGDTTPSRILSVSADPAPVTPEDRERAVKWVTDFRTRAGYGALDRSRIPAVRPLLEVVRMDDRGRRWIQARTRSGVFAFLLDSDGSPVAQVALPDDASRWVGPVVRGDRLTLVQVDSMGVPVVAQYRLGQP